MSAPAQVVLTWNEALSGVFGSISLAAWIFVLVPQLIENYRLQSAEGLSLAFIFVWFIGDVTNLIGAAWAGLVPTVIALAVYFCFADFILIAQCLYYNVLNARRESRRLSRVAAASTTVTLGSETEPLLSRQASAASQGSQIGLPGSHRRRRSSSSVRRGEPAVSASLLQGIAEDGGEEGSADGWLRNTVSVLLVCAIGTVGWAIAYKSGVWQPAVEDPDEDKMAVGPQIFGYVSAVAYLSARIPQILKNQKEKSCDGLSLLFFILSLIGNSTYGAGILFHSVEKQYVLKNLPWLIGSIGTIAEDVIIFIQFRLFRVSKSEAIETA